MSVVTDAINQTRQAVAGVASRNWARPAEAPGTVLTAKGTPSIAPQNIVEVTWKDAVDAINPLQQIPVVGEIYRGVTGEKISGIARVAGGFIFGGITGGMVAALTAAYAEANDDRSPGEQMVAALIGDPTPADTAESQAQLAEARAAATQSPTPAPTTGSGMSDDAVPTVTITAQDTANLQAATPATLVAPATVPQPAKPETVAATPSPGLTSSLIPGVPLRERLNQKKPAAGFSDTPHPLQLSSFVDRMPANAAALTAARQQNLELQQGVTNPTPTPTATQLVRTVATTQPTTPHNPLPADLVRDMMMQALDKYEKLPSVAATDTRSDYGQ